MQLLALPQASVKAQPCKCVVRANTDGTRSGGAQAEHDTYLYRSLGETGMNHMPQNKMLLVFCI